MLSRIVSPRLRVLLRRLGSRGVSTTTAVALVAGLLTVSAGVSVVTAPAVRAAVPAATGPAATGTAGQLVPVQYRALDTRDSAPLTADAWRTVSIAGVGGIPGSGVASVQVTVTVINPAAAGNAYVAPDGFSGTATTALIYRAFSAGTTSATTISSVAANGDIQVKTTTSVDVILDVQGYYTAGDGTPAPGGYVPVQPTRIVDTRTGLGVGGTAAKLVQGTPKNLQVGGVGGVPVGASAVFALLTPISTSTTGGYLTTYPTGTSATGTSLNYMPNAATVIGSILDVSASGAVTVNVLSGGNVDFIVDILGYYTATPGTTGAFTPAATRVYDSRISPRVAIPGSGTITVPLAGVAGVPAAGSGISGIAVNIQAQNGSTGAAGYLLAWGADQVKPGVASVGFPAGTSIRNNLIVVRPGADGQIKIFNSATTAAHVILDVVGWYSNVGTAVPAGQSRTQKRITLQAAAGGGGAWVNYQYRRGITGSFTAVPVVDVTVPGTTTHSGGWPVTTSGGQFSPYTWDLAATVGGGDQLVQVQACYGSSSADTNPVCSMPSNVQLAAHAFGASYATTDIGPGTVAQLTGDLQVSETDVTVASALGSLTVGRKFTTLAPTGEQSGAAGVFGPGWTGAFPGPDAGNADLAVTDQTATDGYLLFTAPDGAVSAYQATSDTTTYPVTFSGIDDGAADGASVTKDSATQITLTDDAGTATYWTKTGATWAVSSVKETGSATATTYTRDVTGRITRILAATPSGISCTTPDTTPGCRSLTFSYITMTVAGASVTRLAGVNLVAYDPAAAAMSTIAVAAYAYNTAGRLTQAWDPRISPSLKTGYGYNSNGRLATLTPPGLAAWTLGYDSSGRLTTASQPDPSGSTATSTVIYDVPFTGAGAPVDVGATQTATWGQTSNLVASGTAVFEPSRVPAAAPTSADWPWADLTFLDVNGRTVNTASFGAATWRLDSTQYDINGNVVRALTAGNLAQSQSTTTDTDPVAVAAPTTAARANLLATNTIYNPLDPSQVTDTFGPIHPVTLTSGALVHARSHTFTAYDEGAPADGVTYALPTTMISSAQDTSGVDRDQVTTRTGYAAITAGDITGWSLRMPTSITAQMSAAPSAADLVTTTRHNSAGQVIEQRLPAGNGSDARSTLTSYYTATGTGTCVSPGLAGLVCSSGPAAQPSTGNPLPVTTSTYNIYNQPLAVTATAGSTVRTTTTTYDAAGRGATVNTTVTPTAAGGTAIPTVTTAYGLNTGLIKTVSAGGKTLTTTYDTLGRQITYTDAAGTVSTTTYDLAGRVATTDDGKGTVASTYDTADEHRNVVTTQNIGVGSAPGTFTATYDPDGNLQTQTYPNGLLATHRYDNTGEPIALTYTKSGSTWLDFTAAVDAQGRTVAQTSPQSAQTYTFDAAGRLTKVTDNAKATSAATTSTCVTRTYTFDANSNRTALASYPDGGGNPAGNCSISTTATTLTSTYDQADRLTNTGYSYDTLGRTTTVPTVDAKGIGTSAAITGNLTVGYHSNDLVATQTQGGQTRTYTLDPRQDRINTTTTGSVTNTNHYDSDSDSPSWTATGAIWTRNITGPDGNLAATDTDTGVVTLQLSNLHGDIIATADNTTTATGVGNYFEATEYGIPRNPAATPDLYSWVGGKQRSTATFGGLTLMGVRLYNPTTGRFLSVDPVYGGNPNAYIYPVDPIDQYDLNGKWGWGWAKKAWRSTKNFYNRHKTAINVVLTVASFIPGVGAGVVVARTTLAARAAYGSYRAKRIFRAERAVINRIKIGYQSGWVSKAAASFGKRDHYGRH
ncbi:RHS repeat-associated protein [Nakamurella sp. UYEF19]|uniref:RHS repeat-associated core domain-containing protein n=1 Tax=Nakamurella sp. UYEF19 TaxID=1756392 RepID=UPI0033989CF7